MGRPKRAPDGRITSPVRFDPDVHAALLVASADRGVSFTWLVNRLCQEGLERLIPVEQLRLTKEATDA